MRTVGLPVGPYPFLSTAERIRIEERNPGNKDVEALLGMIEGLLIIPVPKNIQVQQWTLALDESR